MSLLLSSRLVSMAGFFKPSCSWVLGKSVLAGQLCWLDTGSVYLEWHEWTISVQCTWGYNAQGRQTLWWLGASRCSQHLWTASGIAAFLLRCIVCKRGLRDRNAVRPSVSLSCVNCDKTKAPSQKSSIMTNRKSPTSFAMSLRWTLTPQRGPQMRQFLPRCIVCNAVFPMSVCLSVCLSNAWIVTKRKHLVKKVQLWLIGSRPRAFQWA